MKSGLEGGFQESVSTKRVTLLAPFTVSHTPQGKTQDGT